MIVQSILGSASNKLQEKLFCYHAFLKGNNAILKVLSKILRGSTEKKPTHLYANDLSALLKILFSTITKQ